MKQALWLLLIAAVSSFGCASVKPWERDYLAQPEMSLDDASSQRFERNSEVYREGAVGANGGKSGGGCGCT